MKSYGWTAYDSRVGGSQVIHDAKLNVDIQTDFVKNEDGSAWAVRVLGLPRSGAEDVGKVKTSIIFHIAHESAVGSFKKSLQCERLDGGKGHIAGAKCLGKDPNLGDFEFRVNADPKDNNIMFKAIRSLSVTEDRIWKAKGMLVHLGRTSRHGMLTFSVPLDIFKEQINLDETKDDPGAGNLHFIQFDFEGSFSATLSFRTEGGLHISRKFSSVLIGSSQPTTDNNAADAIGERLGDMSATFSTQIDEVFVKETSFRNAKYGAFIEGLLSNLLGGLGFFHGDSKIDQSHAAAYEETDVNFWFETQEAMSRVDPMIFKEKSLLSFTPSRPFFPRGFLWDEGFHLLPVIEWDLDLAISVLHSWLDLMDDDGWIAREQILGPEARSRVPEEFQTQYPHHANPPTFLALVVPAIMSKLTGASPYYGHPSKTATTHVERVALVKELYPLLGRHYLWFRRIQAGNFTGYPRPKDAIPNEGYRWRGRNPTHTLTSGLDDYPRAKPPHPGELHVDALAWVGASANALLQVAEYLGEKEDVDLYRWHLEDVKHNLDILHWDSSKGAYCDATIADSNKKPHYQHVCHLGYVSLSPLLLGLMNASHPNLPVVLDSLQDPDKLWSPHGLRSLSAADEFYGTGENYWRGAVWMNMNVLAVLRLREIALEEQQGGPTPIQEKALALASELRNKVVNTVYVNYKQTGFAWEQYDDSTGRGSHSRAFTGWTACVLLLIGLELTWGKLGAGTGGAGGRLGVGMGMSWNVISALELAAVILLLVLFRRRLTRLFARTADYTRSWRESWRGRYAAVRDSEMREA